MGVGVGVGVSVGVGVGVSMGIVVGGDAVVIVELLAVTGMSAPAKTSAEPKAIKTKANLFTKPSFL